MNIAEARSKKFSGAFPEAITAIRREGRNFLLSICSIPPTVTKYDFDWNLHG
jgi:hypothetical protein